MVRTLKDLEPGITEESDCGNSPNIKPSWLDMERFKNGQNFFQKHITAMTLALHSSLLVGFSIPSLLEALVFTEQTNTAEKAIKRYFMTFYHIFTWHTGDVWDSDSKAFKSVQNVRNMHNNVARSMTKKQESADRAFVSQYDLAMVQTGFYSAILMYHEGFGVYCTQKELGDYIHFWRGIGYLLGISDKYNTCAGSLDDTKALCKELEQKILLPSLADPPKMFAPMADAYCDGANLAVPLPVNTKEAITAFVLDGMGIPTPKLGWLDWFRYLFFKWQVTMIAYFPGFEKFTNKNFMRNYDRYFKMFFDKPKEE